MTNTTLPTVNIEFRRTVKVRDYESATAAVTITTVLDNLNGDRAANGDKILAAVRDGFFQAKAAVFDELGIQFDVSDSGVVMEAVRGTFGQVTEVHATPAAPAAPAAALAPPPAMTAAPAAAPAAATADEPPYDAGTQDREQKAANGRWAKNRLQSHPDEFWDNRNDKRNPKAPDFKHKNTGIGVWLS